MKIAILGGAFNPPHLGHMLISRQLLEFKFADQVWLTPCYQHSFQKELIDSAFKTLKSKGTLIYSTCTLEPEENEGVVSYLLNRNPLAYLEDIELISLPQFASFKKYITPGITQWSGNKYHSSVKKSVRVIPSSEMMGFYIAKISKK